MTQLPEFIDVGSYQFEVLKVRRVVWCGREWDYRVSHRDKRVYVSSRVEPVRYAELLARAADEALTLLAGHSQPA